MFLRRQIKSLVLCFVNTAKREREEKLMKASQSDDESFMQQLKLSKR